MLSGQVLFPSGEPAAYAEIVISCGVEEPIQIEANAGSSGFFSVDVMQTGPCEVLAGGRVQDVFVPPEGIRITLYVDDS